MKRTKAGAIALMIAMLAMSQSACNSKDQIITEIQTAISEIQTLESVYAQYLTADIKAQLDQALTEFQSLLAVVKTTTGNVAQYIAAIIPIIDQVIAALPAGTLPPLVQTAIIVGLGVVQAVLKEIGAAIVNPPAALRLFMKSHHSMQPGSPQQMAVIREFVGRKCNQR